MKTKQFRILLADDHEVMLEGLKVLLENIPEFKVVGQAKNGKEFIDLVTKLNPDICLIDLDMPVMNGLEAAEYLLGKNPDLKIMMLTMHKEMSILRKVKSLGIKGYITKSTDSSELIFAVHRVLNGKNYYSGQLTDIPLNSVTKNSNVAKIAQLTRREREIVKYLCMGHTNKEIAAVLYISTSTVDNHRTNIMRKLDVHNVVELTRFCMLNDLV